MGIKVKGAVTLVGGLLTTLGAVLTRLWQTESGATIQTESGEDIELD